MVHVNNYIYKLLEISSEYSISYILPVNIINSIRSDYAAKMDEVENKKDHPNFTGWSLSVSNEL
jgi:hypothetical protein